MIAYFPAHKSTTALKASMPCNHFYFKISVKITAYQSSHERLHLLRNKFGALNFVPMCLVWTKNIFQQSSKKRVKKQTIKILIYYSMFFKRSFRTAAAHLKWNHWIEESRACLERRWLCFLVLLKFYRSYTLGCNIVLKWSEPMIVINGFMKFLLLFGNFSLRDYFMPIHWLFLCARSKYLGRFFSSSLRLVAIR